MLKKETIEVKGIKAETEGESFVVKIQVRNPEDRTLYAYGSPRRVFYDNASGKLTLRLHDQDIAEEDEKHISDHLREPRFVPLEGGTETEIKIKLSPLMRRLRPSTERGDGPLFEELRVSEAKEVEVEIAHQDTPFYYNPKLSNARQLKEWGKHVAKGTFRVVPPNPGRNQALKPEPKAKDRKE